MQMSLKHVLDYLNTGIVEIISYFTYSGCPNFGQPTTLSLCTAALQIIKQNDQSAYAYSP